jgi:serine protease Do
MGIFSALKKNMSFTVDRSLLTVHRRRQSRRSLQYSGFLAPCSILVFAFAALTAAGAGNVRITPDVTAIQSVLPSVVNLSAERIVDQSDSPFGFPFGIFDGNGFGPQPGETDYSLGSGCVIDESGLVITNAHVIHRAAKIYVTLSDGRKFMAKELAGDDVSDIALLKITGAPPGTKFPPIKTAVPGDLILGETVIAVGNPFGLQGSISKGILSATGRKVIWENKTIFSDIIQTDAAVYPGSSGGPLINLEGRMIGMNTAVYKVAQGISFAIPMLRIENVLSRWLVPERRSGAALGITPELVKAPGGGMEIKLSAVKNDSPAWRAGLRPGDIIKKINGDAAGGLLELSLSLWRLNPGDTLRLVCGGGKSFSVKVETAPPADGAALALSCLGIGVQPLTPQLASALGYPFDSGALVSAPPDSGASGDIRRGDIIARVNDTPIHNERDLAGALKNTHPGELVELVLISVRKESGKYYLLKKIAEIKAR